MSTNNNYKVVSIISVFLFMLANFCVQAQVAEQQFKLAESYEQGGDLNSALRLYEEIYQTNNKQERYFEPIVRIYKIQNRYEELKPLVEERLKTEQTAKLLILSGEVYWHLGQLNEANVMWDKCKLDYGKDAQVFLDIATVLVLVRSFDKVIQTLQEAKQKFKNNVKILDELVKAYSQTNNYTEGFRELLELFYLTKNLQQAQAKLYGFLGNTDAINHIDKSFNEEIKKDRGNVLLLNFYSWFLRSNKQFDKAFNVIVELDKMQNARGRLIFTFADESRKDAQYDIALKAYQTVYEMGEKNSQYANNAIYYYTKTTEEKLLYMSSQRDIDSLALKQNYRTLLEDYKKIIKEHAKTDFAEQSKISIASIEYDIFENTENAIQMLNSVIETKLSAVYVLKASNKLSDIYISQGEIKKATDITNGVLKQFIKQKNNADIKQDYNIAKFNLAEFLYYQNEIDSAEAIYAELQLTLSEDIANDAMMRLNFIAQNKNFVKPLSLFSQAEYLVLQKQYSKALVNFYEVTKGAEGEAISELALLKSAEMEALLSNKEKSKTLLTTYLADNVYPFYGDNALFLLANIAEEENNITTAIDYYGELLLKFPRSILVTEARERIRILRKV